MHLDLGGDAPPPPDYTPMAEASAESARIAAELGQKQLDQSKEQFDANMAVARPIVDAQTKLMGQAFEQGNKNYAAYETEGRPLQQLLRDDALGVTSAVKQQQMDEASVKATADVTQALDGQRMQTSREMGRMGINPNSGKMMAMQGVMDIQGAKAKAGAMGAARTAAGDKYYAKLGDTFNTYAGIGSSAPAFYQAGTNAGNSATGNQNAVSANYMAGVTGGNSTIMGGRSLAQQGLGSVLSAQTGYANSFDSSGGGMGGLGSLLGGAASLYTKFGSHPDYKQNIVRVGDHPLGIGVYEFDYRDEYKAKWGEGRQRGVMATELVRVLPAAVTTDADGHTVVDYAMLVQ